MDKAMGNKMFHLLQKWLIIIGYLIGIRGNTLKL
jgi:hypothetical protein